MNFYVKKLRNVQRKDSLSRFLIWQSYHGLCVVFSKQKKKRNIAGTLTTRSFDEVLFTLKLSQAMFYRHKVYEVHVSTIITQQKKLLKKYKKVRTKKLALARVFHNLTQETCSDTCVTDTGAFISYGKRWVCRFLSCGLSLMCITVFSRENMSTAISWLQSKIHLHGHLAPRFYLKLLKFAGAIMLILYMTIRS